MTLRTVMKQLQEIFQINDAELARETGIPQATIYRLVSGMTDDPKVSTLKPLASFFNITIGQLLGEEPLPPNMTERFAGSNQWIYRLPIISWEQARDWQETVNKLSYSNWSDWCSTNFPVSNSAYALQVMVKTLAPPFTEGAAVIVEPNLQPEDGDTVVIHSSGMNAVALRRWMIDAGEIWLAPLQTSIGATKLGNNHAVCGVAIQVYVQLKEGLV